MWHTSFTLSFTDNSTIEDLFDESSCQFNLSKRHSKGSTPNLELVDVKDGGLVLWEEENDVFSGQKPLEAHLRLQVCSEKWKLCEQLRKNNVHAMLQVNNILLTLWCKELWPHQPKRKHQVLVHHERSLVCKWFSRQLWRYLLLP